MPIADERQDFLNQMYLAVLEECPLHELANGSTDLLPEGPVVHGPWPPQACAAVLRAWLGAGWLTLYYPDWPAQWNLAPAQWTATMGADRSLAGADATDLLQQPHRWLSGQADGHVCLCRSTLGLTTNAQEWLALASQAAPDLPG